MVDFKKARIKARKERLQIEAVVKRFRKEGLPQGNENELHYMLKHLGIDPHQTALYLKDRLF